jgi:hypothetical protein
MSIELDTITQDLGTNSLSRPACNPYYEHI